MFSWGEDRCVRGLPFESWLQSISQAFVSVLGRVTLNWRRALESAACVCLRGLPQEQLVEYVRSLKARAAVDDDDDRRGFDREVVDELMLKTPRIVQQAILEEVHHAGHSNARCSGS